MTAVRDSRQGLAGSLALLAGTVALLFALQLGSDERPRPAIAGSAPDAAGLGSGDPAAKLDPEALLELGLGQTPVVAERIAEIRELDFEQVPEPQIADTGELREIAQAELAKPRVQEEIEAADAALKLLGLLEPDRSLGDVATDVTASAAAYYDPRQGELFLVGDSVPAGPALAEFVLAHELNHALEDQVFGLPRPTGVSDDRALAESALVEGSATALMQRYAQVYLNPFELASEATGLDAGAIDLPRFAEAEVTFSYLGGQRFVDELLRTGGDWKLVDFAYQRRLPRSTEQILHPEKYLADERALRVPPPPAPGEGWTQVDDGDVGEFATREILREDATEVGADEAAAGWGGDAYRLFARDGEAGGCSESCRGTHALAVAWRGDDRREARELAAALRKYVPSALGGNAGSSGSFALDGGWAAVSRRGDRVGLGLAPSEDLALRLAARPIASVPVR